jgi:YVTN family beta-propeller protein
MTGRRRDMLRVLVIAVAALSTCGAGPGVGRAAESSPGVVRIVDVDEQTGETTLRTVAPAGTPSVVQSPTADPDSFLVFSHRWDTPAGGCQLSGWTGDDLSTRVYAHVSNRWVVNFPPIFMGTQSLWFGADMNSAPDEVRNWPYSYGYGSYWSQRLASPTFSLSAHPTAVFHFDGRVDFVNTGSVIHATPTSIRYLSVQARTAGGTWHLLKVRYTVVGAGALIDTLIAGRGAFQAEAHFDGDGNQTLGLADPVQIRIVVQTPPTGTQERGAPSPPSGTEAGAAEVDNVVLEDGSNILSPVDFEDGTTGLWTLSAVNGDVRIINPTFPFGFTRDLDPSTSVAQRPAPDFSDPTCAWTFTDGGDSLPHGLLARITSPWVPIYRHPPIFTVGFGGKLPVTMAGPLLSMVIRGKRVGETGPSTIASPTFLSAGGTSTGDDSGVPYGEIPFRTYPFDFSTILPGNLPIDSVQVVFLVIGRYEQFFSTAFRTRLPYISMASVTEFDVDADHDGVPDAVDACPGEDATGRDANGDGCVDTVASLRHVETWALPDRPIHWRMSRNGDPSILDGSDTTAIRNAFATWQAVPGTSLSLVEDPATTVTNASVIDSVNLVTFEDEYAFPSNVLAVTPTTSYTKRSSFYDRPVVPGQIVDADILFNPASSFRTPSSPGGAFDIQSIATHEIGHLLGLSHSPAQDATMFPVLQNGTLASTLESDDEAALYAAYPGQYPDPAFGRIAGTVTRGGAGTPVGGAAVLAVRLDGGGAPIDTAASDFTDETGAYRLYHLAPGNYAVRVMPLDGSISGLVPEAINARVESIAQTNFEAEWYGGPEGSSDDPSIIQPVSVSGGGEQNGIDVVTNIDVTPPLVADAAPDSDQTGVAIDTPVLVTFSEAVADTTLGSAFKLHVHNGSGTLGGRGQLLPPGNTFVFTPSSPLAFGTSYDIQVTTALRDRQGNALASTYTTTFTTETQPTIAITDVQPRQCSPGSLVTVRGVGFVPLGYNRVLFTVSGGAQDSVPSTQVTPTSMVVRVPANAATGAARVVGTNFEVSNAFNVNVLPVTARVAPAPSGAAVPLSFRPTDVAVSPEATSVYAVGDTGYATVSLCACRPPFRAESFHSLPGSRHAALSPDGRRLYVTRPDSSDVVEVSADTSSGQYGQVLAKIAIVGGTPDGIVVSATGQRLYASDDVLDQIHEIDVNPASLAFRSVLGHRTVSGAVLTGGLAFDPTTGRLLATTRNEGLVSVDLSQDSAWVTIAPAATANAVAATPGGTEALAGPSPDVGSPPLVFAKLPAGATNGSIPLGGEPRDVIVEPRGLSAYVVNGAADRLQVLDVADSTSLSYHLEVASVATGATPVAIAMSGDGDLLAVANFGESSVSLYRVGGSVELARATPSVAAPGDAVVLAPSSGSITAGTTVDLGQGDIPILDSAGPDPAAAAFIVPDMPQQDTHVSLGVPPESHTLALPFRVVDPIMTFSAAPTGLVATTMRVACAADSQSAPLERLRTSPDGRLLAVFKRGVAPGCGEVIDLVEVAVDAQGRYAHRLASVVTPYGSLVDAQFTADGRQLWMLVDPAVAAEIRVLDTDPSSGTFGQEIGAPIALGTLPLTARLAADPAGRFMALASSAIGGVRRYRLDRTVLDTTPVSGAGEIAISPDGRLLIAAAGGAANIYRATSAGVTLAGTTPLHTGTIDRLVVTTNGKRAFGHYSGGEFDAWNLDESAGATGTELAFGLLSAGPLGDWIPAPDGSSCIMGSPGDTLLRRIGAASGSFTTATTGIGAPGPRLARSVDGRVVWAGAITGQVRGFSLSTASTLSVVAGLDQETLLGATLPQPVRVQVVNAAGRPASGVVVTFTLANVSQGSLGAAPGSLQQVRVTDARGEAECIWTMPATASTNSVTISALGVPGGAQIVTARSVESDLVAAPSVIEMGPADGAVGIDASTELFVRFSQSMNPDSIGRYLVVWNGLAPLNVFQVHLEEDGRVAIVTPPAPFTFGVTCSLKVVRNAPDREGQRLADSSMTRFTIQPQPSLALTSASPPAGPSGASVVIEGDGFSAVPAQNTIVLNGVVLPAQSASPKALVVRIPEGALTGDLTVQVGNTTSNALHFVVLPKTPQLVNVYDTRPASPGVRDIAIVSGELRGYATSPPSNSVTAFQVVPIQTLAIIPVGLDPQAIALLPDASRAYVANRGSNDVSVIDIDPESPQYHHVIDRVHVGVHPVDVAVAATGPSVLVVNEGDSTISIIDAGSKRASDGQVVRTVKTGGSGSQVVVNPDGTAAYVATSGGVDIVDLASRSVVSTVKTGAGGKQVAVNPDGTLLFVLAGDGTILVVDVTAGSASFSRVVSTVKTGASSGHIAVSPDGTGLYVTIRDLQLLLSFRIVQSNQSGASSTLPGPAVTLEPLDTLAVGRAPASIAFESSGAFGVIANEGDGTLQVLTTGSPLVNADVTGLDTFDLNASGQWITVYLEAAPPFGAAGISPASVRLNGIVPADVAADTAIVDHDGDALPDLALRVRRSALPAGVPTGGAVTIGVTGTVGVMPFTASDVVSVRRGAVSSPSAGAVVAPGQTVSIAYTIQSSPQAPLAAILVSTDHGATWSTATWSEPNVGNASWVAPNHEVDSIRVAVVEIEQQLGDGKVKGVWSESADFAVHGTVSAALVPAALELAPIRPNPSFAALTVRFGLPRQGQATLELFDVSGRRVKVLARGTVAAGWHEVTWRGDLEGGGTANAGLYFVRLRAGGKLLRQRFVWLR